MDFLSDLQTYSASQLENGRLRTLRGTWRAVCLESGKEVCLQVKEDLQDWHVVKFVPHNKLRTILDELRHSRFAMTSDLSGNRPDGLTTFERSVLIETTRLAYRGWQKTQDEQRRAEAIKVRPQPEAWSYKDYVRAGLIKPCENGYRPYWH